MADDGNTSRQLYSRFNFRITYIEPLRKDVEDLGLGVIAKYKQTASKGSSDIRIDARLDSVDFYTDPTMLHFVYEYTP